jgi:hypothetical protein
MRNTPQIIGIRPVKGADGLPTGRWAVVGERVEAVEQTGPGDYNVCRVTVLMAEHASKREAIIASGTNRVVA